MTAVVRHQKEFLDKGPKYLKTLTLKQVARRYRYAWSPPSADLSTGNICRRPEEYLK
ncbi:MAG: hypothetical protein ACLVHQ_02665 [Oscillospiraceae bacterium]